MTMYLLREVTAMNSFKLWALALTTTLLLMSGQARADEYGKWVKNEKEKILVCEYKYETKKSTKDKPDYNVQKVVIYYEDPDRKNFAYYYNAKNEPWARCATPTHPKWDAKVMYWQQLGGGKDSYKDYDIVGYCPAPGDGKNSIPTFPLPPK